MTGRFSAFSTDRAEKGKGEKDINGVTEHTATVAAPEDVDVWGSLDENAPNYRNLGWIRGSVLCTKVQIGLGVLGIPSVCHTLGLIPAIIVIVAIGAMTFWCQLIIGQFKLRYPSVYSVADVGQILFGPVGREVWGFIYWVDLTAVAGAGMIGIATAFNAMSEHGACTVIFVAVGAILTFLVSVIQTLDRISFIGWIGIAGILSAVITLTVSVGLQDRPAAAPQTGPWDRDFQLFASPTFLEAMAGVSTIVFSYAGAPNYFGIISELRRPKDYKKSFLAAQIVTAACYLIIGSVVYHFVGQWVASPALGSAGPLMKKVCYGLALPGLIVGAVLNTHLPAKYIFVRILGKSRHLTENTLTHRAVWTGCVVANCAISFIIAESIPVFNDIIGLIGAVLANPLSLLLEPLMWFHLYRLDRPSGWIPRTAKDITMVTLNLLIGLVSIYIIITGGWANGESIKNNVAGGAVFSCADNSGSA